MLPETLSTARHARHIQPVQQLRASRRHTDWPYEILASIGSGGMGEVYRARHTARARRGAEVPARRFASDPERLLRFEREAKLASLNHPRIAQIYGFEQTTSVPDGRTFVFIKRAGSVGNAAALPSVILNWPRLLGGSR